MNVISRICDCFNRSCTWKEFANLLSNPSDFLKSLQYYDVDAMPRSLQSKIRSTLKSDSIADIMKISNATGQFYEWLRATIEYHDFKD